MWVGSTELYNILKKRREFSDAQAYLIAELAYASGARELISDTFSRITTMRNLQRRGLLEPEIEGLSIKLTDEGRNLVTSIHPVGFSWQQ